MKKERDCETCGERIQRYECKSGKYFCCIPCKSAWQKKQREDMGFTREWLEREYLVEGKSASQIAREIGRDGKRVWEWLRDYGIPIRPRGGDYGNRFVKGRVSAFKGLNHTKENKDLFRELRLKDGRVPYLKDGKHWLSHEGAKPSSWKGGVTPERQAFYASLEWATAVKAVWARDNAECQNCGKHHNTTEARGTFHIHHIVSFQITELRAEVSNLVLLCRECHLWVHSNKNTTSKFIKDFHA